MFDPISSTGVLRGWVARGKWSKERWVPTEEESNGVPWLVSKINNTKPHKFHSYVIKAKWCTYWKVLRDAKMEPLIQTLYFLFGGATTLIFMLLGANVVISLLILSAMPRNIVEPSPQCYHRGPSWCQYFQNDFLKHWQMQERLTKLSKQLESGRINSCGWNVFNICL